VPWSVHRNPAASVQIFPAPWPGRAAALLARDPVGQASLDSPDPVAKLLEALRAAGAGDAVTFDLFLEVCPGEASSYPVGREPDGTPSQPWRWQEPTGQPR
jgi:hypothetical protein